MSITKKINDPSGKVYDEISIGAITFDTEPIEGSFNPVTSDAVAKIAGDVAELDAIVPEGASEENKLVSESGLHNAIDEVTLDPSAVAFGNAHLLDEATEFAADAGVLVDSATDGPKFMKADTLLELMAQNALAGNVAPEFVPNSTTTRKESPYVYNGLTYVAKEDGYQGPWDNSKFVVLPSGLIANRILETIKVSLTGVSVSGTPGDIIRYDIHTDSNTKVYLSTPSAWSVENIPYMYVFTCGYVDGDGVDHDVVTANASQLAGKTGQTFELPIGYTDYYVCMRGDSGEVADFVFSVEPTIENYVKGNIISSLIDVPLAGAGDDAKTRHIQTNSDAKVYVKVPSTAWACTAIPYKNIFTCGYVDGDGESHDVISANAAHQSEILGKTFELPVGYTDYYIFFRGDSGETVDFSFVVRQTIKDYVKEESGKVVRKTTLSVEGHGTTETVVQYPVYGTAKMRVKMPSSYPATALGPYNMAFEIGYYSAVTDGASPRTALVGWNKTQVQDHLNEVIEYTSPSTTKSLYIFVRNDVGTTLNFDVEIEQSEPTESENLSSEIRSVELALDTKEDKVTDYSVLNYNAIDLRANGLTAGVSASDFPSSMKSHPSTYIKAHPIVRNPGTRTVANGFCIAPDGKIIVVHYSPGTYLIGIGDLYNSKFAGFTKTLYVGGAVHANYAFFGSEKYDAGDTYPLLYVGGIIGDASTSTTINVLRIVGSLDDAAACSFTLVQTITLDYNAGIGAISDVKKWGSKLVAWFNDRVYVYDNFPQLSDGNTTLTSADLEDSYTLADWTNRGDPQSGCIVGDKLYEITGYDANCHLAVIDLVNKTCKQTPMPVYDEWETLCYFDNLFFSMTITNGENGVVGELVICSLEFSL